MLNEAVIEKIRKVKEEAKQTDNDKKGVQFQAKLTSEMVGAIADLAELVAKIHNAGGNVTVKNQPTEILTPDVTKQTDALRIELAKVAKAVEGNKPLSNAKVESLMNGVLKAVEKLPTSFPEQKPFPTSMKVEQTNQIDYKKDFEKLTNAISDISHTYAPEINVPEPQVKVVRESSTLLQEIRRNNELLTQLLEKEMPLTDMAPLKKAVDKTTKAINDINIPIPPTMPRTLKVTNVDGTPIMAAGSEYASKVTVVGDITYIGEADPGTAEATAGWRARRVDSTGGNVVVTWADGNNNFDNVATDLTVLSYS